MTRTLHIEIGTTPDRSDLEADLAALDADEAVASSPSRLAIESLETFGRIFRPTNLEILETLAEYDPDSIRELARLLDRHPPEVTKNVHELVDYGLVEIEDSGRAKRPRVWYDEIAITGDLPLADVGGGHSAEAAP